MNWSYYWHTKLGHKHKRLCSGFMNIDSFSLLKNNRCIERYEGQTLFEVPQYELKILRMHNYCLVAYAKGTYRIPIASNPCNYGGIRNFFHCPDCSRRVRFLYCNKGKFLCRKCLNLCYFTQLLSPSDRCLEMADKVERNLKNRAGSLERKPPWMKRRKFNYFRDKFFSCLQIQYPRMMKLELLVYYPHLAPQIHHLI